MKRLKLIVMIAAVLVTASATAQTKIGFIRLDDIIGLMPEVQSVNMDTLGQKFIQDSVVPKYEYMGSEYERKLIEYGDTTKPKAIREIMLQDLQRMKEELDNAQSVVQQVMQYKRQQFLQPFYVKADAAIKQVAKEKGYLYVLEKDAFRVAPEADDLTIPVLTKLNIKLPPQSKQQAPR